MQDVHTQIDDALQSWKMPLKIGAEAADAEDVGQEGVANDGMAEVLAGICLRNDKACKSVQS